MKNQQNTVKRGVFARLARCTLGGGNAVVVGLVATGIAVSFAALVGSRTTTAVGNGSSALGARTNQGAAGYTAGSP